ncbi:NusG domain II-containing protein [uncultured Ilyobacter sp.]|uniref:NusG domain II-containing protein n=1 Tax=uncultured Ilyobacter sp. TaxID=544433 RepID=UPI0029F4B540|nr:NusG domain II-containing protein [uncultured Ilyobacter sp.]
MKRKRSYFKKGDIILYAFIFSLFTFLLFNIKGMKTRKASKAEIYVDGDLKYIYKLQEDEKNIFVDTNLGGINVQFKDKMVRVTSSNSPLKLIVKQGWAKVPGDTLIGIPDRAIVKIVGENNGEEQEDDIDFIIK